MNRTLLLMFVIVLSIALSGCSFAPGETSVPADQQQTNTEATANPESVEKEQTAQETPAAENEAEVTLELKQYFASSTYVYDGIDEENGELMPAVSQSIKVAKDDNPYMAAIKSLQTAPGSDYYTAVSKSYTINDITVKDGVATVDFASTNLYGGDMTEAVLIDQIVYTLINSFSDIKAVAFTVDGASAETLMGNVDITGKFLGDN